MQRSMSRSAAPFLVDQPPGAAAMQGRHELVFGLERDRVQPWMRDAQLGFEQPGFASHNDERCLGRISLDSPAAFLVHELRIVGEQAGLEALGQRGMLRQARGSATEEVQRAARLVTGAGDGKGFPVGEDFLHGHLVLGERAGLVRADDRGATEGLDGGQFANDHPGALPCGRRRWRARQ